VLRGCVKVGVKVPQFSFSRLAGSFRFSLIFLRRVVLYLILFTSLGADVMLTLNKIGYKLYFRTADFHNDHGITVSHARLPFFSFRLKFKQPRLDAKSRSKGLIKGAIL
jgi:hypothetical protein